MHNPKIDSKTSIITYYKSLDGLRGIAILLVILWHYVACLLRPDGGIASVTRSLLASSWSGVDLFFVLSGFLLGRVLILNIKSKNFYSTFYIRRALRIFPLYYLFLIIYFLLKRTSLFMPDPLSGEIPSWTYFFHIQNFYMSDNFGGSNLGVTWSLAIEEQFYLILPLLIRLSKKFLKYFIITGIILAPIFRYYIGVNYAYVLLPARIDSLLFGVGVAYLVVNYNLLKWGQRNFKLLVLSVLALLVLIAILSIYTKWNITGGTWNHSVYAVMYSIIIVISLSHSNSIIKNIIESPALVYVGKVSYGLYLIHLPVLSCVFNLFTHKNPQLLNPYDFMIISISFIICLGLLHVSNKFYETPIRNFGKKFNY